MNRYEAEQLLKRYRAALLTKFRDWGDHPYESNKIDVAVMRIEEEIVQALTQQDKPKE